MWSFFSKPDWNLLVSFYFAVLSPPTESCYLQLLPNPPWGGECGSSSSFYSSEPVLWNCFPFEMLRQQDASCQHRVCCKQPAKAHLICRKNLPNLSPATIFNNSPALVSCTLPAQQTTRHVFVFFSSTAASFFVFFYLFADSWFGGGRLNQLIEDLQNHKCGYQRMV